MSSAKELVAATRSTFESGVTRSIEWRKKQLHGVYKMLVEQEEAIVKALYDDLRKSKEEAMIVEVIVSRNEALHVLKNVATWCKPTFLSKTLAQTLDTTYLHKEPLGVALVIGAWNYPLVLTIFPLVAAIAAGNCVILKPSEIASHTAKMLVEHLHKYIDKDCFPIYTGGIPETTLLLEQRFDHIFYTGSSNVGKVIMAAAAKHLTPVILELGGKSPTYIDKHISLGLVVRRVLWGKLINAGQTCIAPDYILCHKDVLQDVIDKMQEVLKEMVGENPKESEGFARIVSDRHFERVKEIMDGMPNEKIVIGGDSDADTKYIAPTVYKDVSADDIIMESEIFGPLLPILAVSDHEEAIDFINRGEKPLSMYIFSNDNQVVEDMLDRTSAGGVCVNDTLMHCSSSYMPFGGVGSSGFGRYHGKFGFDALTHEKPVCWRKQNMEGMLKSRYMPLTEAKLNTIKRLTEDKPGSFCAIL